MAHVLGEREELHRNEGDREDAGDHERHRLSAPRQLAILDPDQAVREDQCEAERQHLGLSAKERDSAQNCEQNQVPDPPSVQHTVPGKEQPRKPGHGLQVVDVIAERHEETAQHEHGSTHHRSGPPVPPPPEQKRQASPRERIMEKDQPVERGGHGKAVQHQTARIKKTGLERCEERLAAGNPGIPQGKFSGPHGGDQEVLHRIEEGGHVATEEHFAAKQDPVEEGRGDDEEEPGHGCLSGDDATDAPHGNHAPSTPCDGASESG